MELLDILRHAGAPRTEYFLDLPTPYGKLRLDLIATPDIVLTQTSMTDAMCQDADQQIAAAFQLVDTDPQATEQGLLAVTAQYPNYRRTYGALGSFYSGVGNFAEAEYQVKQLIALQPDYENLSWLGQLLGRQQRYAEARALQSYLWEYHATATAEAAIKVCQDYLVTLTRLQDGQTMITVADTAMREYGGTSTLYYQYLLGHVLDNQLQTAKDKLAAVLPQLNPQDPLYTRFMDMEKLINSELDVK